MLTFQILEKVNPNDWNNDLKKSKFTNFFQTYEYLNTQSNIGKRFPLFISIFDEKGETKGQLGLLIQESVTAHSSLQMNRFLNLFSNLAKRGSWVSGPIIHEEDNDTRFEILKSLVLALNEVAKKYNLALIDGYSPPLDTRINSRYLELFKNESYQIENFFTFITDLHQPLDVIWNKIHNSTKRDVQRAQKRGIIVKELDDYNELENYFLLTRQFGKTKGMVSENFSEKYKEKFWQCIKSGIEKVFLSYEDGELVAGHRLGCFNHIVYSNKVTNSYVKPTSLGGPILTWHALNWAKQAGMRVYDFSGGESPPTDESKMERYRQKWESLLSYKRKWGGTELSYYHFVKTFSKKKYKFFRIIYKPDYALREYKRKHYRRTNLHY